MKRVLYVLVLLVLLAGTVSTVGAQMPANRLPPVQSGIDVQPEGAVQWIEASPSQQQQVLDMWTPEARAAAKPLPLPAASPGELEGAGLESLGQPGMSLGGLPDPAADSEAQSQFPDAWQISNELSMSEMVAEGIAGTAAVYTGYRVNYHTQMHKYYPYYTVGKLYFTTPSGNSYCTASVISPNNIIVTAAHCVYSGGWYSNWSFVPADRAGTAPYGSFAWTQAWVLVNWQNTGQTRYDVALIKLGNNSSGKPVTYYTGYLGRSWNYNYVQHHHTQGYPSSFDSGKYTYLCAAESFNGGTDVLGMGCNMTYGSSGGPWCRNFAPYVSGMVNHVNSVVSGGTPGTNTFYGARFSDNNIVPLCNAAGC